MTTALRIDPGALRPGVLTPPPSKSDAQRALVVGALRGVREPAGLWAMPESRLPADVRVVRRAIAQLEAAGPAGAVSIDCGDGGAPLRILLGQAALCSGRTELRGSARLAARPHQPLIVALREALEPAGLRIEEGRPWPITVHGVRARPPVAQFTVDAALSGQFVSSLLLTAAGLSLRDGRAWRVQTTGAVASEGYVDLTLHWLKQAGFEVAREPGAFTVRAGVPSPSLPEPPGDWSSIGYLLLTAWASGAEVRSVDPGAEHPDRYILRALEDAGLKVMLGGGNARVSGRPARGVKATGDECPDLLPTLAAFGCVLPAPTTLERVEILRDKESDRVEGIRDLVAAAGGRTELQDGSRLVVFPPAAVRPFRFHSRGDHRMAMAAATLGVIARVPVEVEDPYCVEKSFPGFYDALAEVGCVVSALD